MFNELDASQTYTYMIKHYKEDLILDDILMMNNT